MLNDIIEGGLIEARGIVGFYACNSNEQDDIEVYAGDGSDKSNILQKFFTLRQQEDRGQDQFLALSDFIAPKSSNRTDYIGMFAVSAGFKQE
mmetsp:Transcript_42145/g.30885  ORF Transcript_42145/g.30885 Transcript_42145/m.30885 type:complete len:92 (+) Transcript_42145:489-764(+)